MQLTNYSLHKAYQVALLYAQQIDDPLELGSMCLHHVDVVVHQSNHTL